MIGLIVLSIAVICSAIPAVMLLANWRLYRALPPACDTGDSPAPAVSLLIPARNEELSIEQAVRSAMQSAGVELEIIVLDDHSQDQTASIVRKLSAEDSRVRLETAPPLPQGWCGKQHACWVLSRLAQHDLLVWIDADVRLAPDALRRMVQYIRSNPAGLISGVPRQITITLFEQLIIPLIHFVLLGYLPISRMRQFTSPGYAAGCGQLFMARRDCYEKSGGHAVIRASLHDGIMLPRAFRRAGIATDLFDATEIAECRMYRSARQVFGGFAKNATEAMATVTALPAWTFLLLGYCLPWVVVPLLICHPQFVPSFSIRLIWDATLFASLITSGMLAIRFRQTILSWLLRPIGILVLLAIQYYALARKLAGLKTHWKSRGYAPSAMSK